MEFCVLGGLEVRSARGRLAVGGQKPSTVLAMLLLHANATVPVDHLVDAVWPASAPASAAKNLQTYVWSLRRTLTEPGDDEPRILTRPAGYLLRLRDGELDLREFERLSQEGRRLVPTDPAAAGELLRAALRLCRGPLLPDLADLPGVAVEAARVEELRLATVEERVEADLALGRHTDLVAELASLVAAQPLRERLRGQQIRALHRCGRRADALAAFQDLRQRLDRDLGIRPGAPLQRLHQAVLRADAEPPAKVRTVPAQLPADTAEFTGRAAHLRLLDDAFGGGVRTVTVVGSSGVGKTSLAVRWAHQARDRFPDGQLYVNLRGRTTPTPAVVALAQFLRALGVPPEQVPVAEDEAAGLYRSLLSDRKILVVLDDAHDAEQVRPLLPGSPLCAVLVTSRNRLAGLVAREGARPLTLDVLPAGEADLLVRRLLGERRAAAEPDAVAGLTAACGYLPLALRIAVAHLTTHPHVRIADYTAELGADRLAALRVDGDPESAVSIAFDQSYRVLDPEARRLFGLLSLAPGSDVSATAAAALAGRPVRACLDRLVGSHMISEPAAARYTMHDLLRWYARQHAAEDPESPAAADRLVTWYVRTASAAAGLVYPQMVRLAGPPPSPDAPFTDRAEALAWLDAERANLVATTLTAGGTVAWRLADALRGYFRLRRIGVDWLAIAEAGLAAAEATGDDHGRAAAGLSLADAYWSTGRHDEAATHYARARECAARVNWVEGLAAVSTGLGTLHWELGRLAEATEHYTAALAHNRTAGLVAGEAASLNNLGMVHRQLGQLDTAISCYRQALARHETGGSRVGAGNALANLGVVYRLLGRLTEAVTHLEAGLAVHREYGSRAGEAQILADLAEVHRLRGRPAEALELLADALHTQREIDNNSGAAATLYLLALAHRDLGAREAALAHARESVALAGQNRRCAALAATVMAGINGSLDEHTNALELARTAGSAEAETDALLGLAETTLRVTGPADATEPARAALALARRTGHRVLESRALGVLAAIELARADATAAGEYAEAALAIHQDIMFGQPD